MEKTDMVGHIKLKIVFGLFFFLIKIIEIEHYNLDSSKKIRASHWMLRLHITRSYSTFKPIKMFQFHLKKEMRMPQIVYEFIFGHFWVAKARFCSEKTK